VTWKSIARARHRSQDAGLRDAVDRDAEVFDYRTRLLDVLRSLREHGFVFVRDFDQQITGIVTDADVVEAYHRTATPFLLIGEIDQLLREVILDTFDEDTIGEACRRTGLSLESADRMSVSHYCAVLANRDCWAELDWRADREVFIKRLNEIREVRNRVTHFNPDPVNAGDVEKLRLFLKLVRELRGDR
jgi:CBS domain-containing protein